MDPHDRPAYDAPREPIGPQGCVITQPEPAPRCLYCQAPLRPPKIASRPPRFCPGSRCRSAWHLEQRRQLVAAVEAELAGIRDRLDQLSRLVQELK